MEVSVQAEVERGFFILNYFTMVMYAHRSGEYDKRMERVKNKILEVYNHPYRYVYSKKPMTLIDEIYDHEGMLSVYWLDEPTPSERRFLTELWGGENELAINVHHYLRKKTVIDKSL